MSSIKLFESRQVRTAWNEQEHKWYFSIIDVIEVLEASARPRKYWNDLKRKLLQEGYHQLSEKIGQLRMEASDGKRYLTDVADAETLLRLIQSIPSPKAEPFKRWLARVGYERLEEIENPELAQTPSARRPVPLLEVDVSCGLGDTIARDRVAFPRGLGGIVGIPGLMP